MSNPQPIAERDPKGFWQTAYHQHGPAVLAFLQRRLGRREEAEDLLQEAFVRAIRADSFRQDGDVRAYLFRIAHNLLINQSRRPQLFSSLEETPVEEPGATSPSPEQDAILSRLRADISRVVLQMSADHRRAFELGIVAQHSYHEIATMTGWSLPQVKVNIYRARRRILDDLGKDLLAALAG